MPDDKIEELKKQLRFANEDCESLRNQRDYLRNEIESLKSKVESEGSAQLNLLAKELSEKIKVDFYGNVERLLWLFGILLAVATAGGYLTFSSQANSVITEFERRTDDEVAKIDKKVGTAVRTEVANHEDEIDRLREKIIDAVVEFGSLAQDEIKHIRAEKEIVITEFEANATQALNSIDEIKKRVENEGQRTQERFAYLRTTEAQYVEITRMKDDIFRTIPVVVHLVEKEGVDFIPDEQVHSQIDVLNEDFQARNADLSTVPAPFAPLVGNAQIAFELAKIDPNGNPTTGITKLRLRDDSERLSPDDIRRASTGGVDSWDTRRYLNIWVAELDGGILGTSGNSDDEATDGIVVEKRAFGRHDNLMGGYDKGRSTTNLIGKWLGLKHIWGEIGCSGSDGIDDTPNQHGPNFGTPEFPQISCDNGPNGDMFMNFLDYGEDETIVMFTKGQVERMHETLIARRFELGRN